MPTEKKTPPPSDPVEPVLPVSEPVQPLVALPPAPAGQVIRKPGKVQAIAIMTLVSGILNCLWGLSAAISLVAANFFACYWAPYAITLGVLEIIYASKLMSARPSKIQPAKYLAIMMIINITTLNVYSLFVGDLVAGILILVFYNDPEVQAYFNQINNPPQMVG